MLGQLAKWIATAWEDIPAAIIVHAFRKCFIFNALDSTGDNTLWEESDEESSDIDMDDDDKCLVACSKQAAAGLLLVSRVRNKHYLRHQKVSAIFLVGLCCRISSYSFLIFDFQVST